MRIYLSLSANKTEVPFNYQSYLVGAFHKWLGNTNALHETTSLYSLSWLSNGTRSKNGLTFNQGSIWFISAHDVNVIKKLILGIQQMPEVAFGMEVDKVAIQETPVFTSPNTFIPASPVFIKTNEENGKQKFYFYTDPESEMLLTRSFHYKLAKANLNPDGARVWFDTAYNKAHTKKITYKGIDLKGSLCAVVVEGSPEQLAFAWNTGVGNSTGIGFGALH